MAQGMVFIYHCPGALAAHVDWTIAGVSDIGRAIDWITSPHAAGGFSGSVDWQGDEEAGATLASAFMNLKQLTFEITQDSGAGGARWSFTPSLGLFYSATDSAGNLLVSENQIRLAMEKSGSNNLRLQAELRRLLGQNFDDELEPLRESLAIRTEGYNSVVPTESKRVANSQNIRPR